MCGVFVLQDLEQPTSDHTSIWNAGPQLSRSLSKIIRISLCSLCKDGRHCDEPMSVSGADSPRGISSHRSLWKWMPCQKHLAKVALFPHIVFSTCRMIFNAGWHIRRGWKSAQSTYRLPWNMSADVACSLMLICWQDAKRISLALSAKQKHVIRLCDATFTTCMYDTRLLYGSQKTTEFGPCSDEAIR